MQLYGHVPRKEGGTQVLVDPAPSTQTVRSLLRAPQSWSRLENFSKKSVTSKQKFTQLYLTDQIWYFMNQQLIILCTCLGSLGSVINHRINPISCHSAQGVRVRISAAVFVVFVISANRTAQIRLQCRKTTFLSCRKFLITTGVGKMNNI